VLVKGTLVSSFVIVPVAVPEEIFAPVPFARVTTKSSSSSLISSPTAFIVIVFSVSPTAKLIEVQDGTLKSNISFANPAATL
jgi:hypothetical protein